MVWHPSHSPALQFEQIEYLLALQSACRHSEHEWLLEVVPPKAVAIADPQTAQCIERLYSAGLRPDWWKLPLAEERATWHGTLSVIRSHDPYCRGVVVLGLDQPIEDLRRGFQRAPAELRGFMVGRSIFSSVARAWFGGELSDEEAVQRLCANYRSVMNAWTDAA